MDILFLKVHDRSHGIATNPLAIPFLVVSRLVWLANFSEFTLTSRLNNPLEGNDNVWFEIPFMAVTLLLFTTSCPFLVRIFKSYITSAFNRLPFNASLKLTFKLFFPIAGGLGFHPNITWICPASFTTSKDVS